MSARTDDVARAVALIDPDRQRHAECVNAVHVALAELKGTDADLRRAFHSKTRPARSAAKRLHKAVERLQETLADSDLPEYLRSYFPPTGSIVDDGSVPRGRDETARWLALWQKRIGAATHDKSETPFNLKAWKKLRAAEQAYKLLRQFNRDISTTKDSAFCKLAALLHGAPKAGFQRPCWQVSWSALRIAEIWKK